MSGLNCGTQDLSLQHVGPFFLAALGLCCCAQAFSSCSEQGLLFVVAHGLLIAVASRCGEQALGTWASVVAVCGLSSCGMRARRLSSCGAWT